MEYLSSAYTIFIHIPDMVKHIPDVISYFYEDPFRVFFISDISLGIIFTFIQVFIWGGLDYYEIRSYFDKHSSSRLCIKWQESYPGTKMSEQIRGEISDALERRGEDGLKCSNPSSDSNQISQEKLLKAQQCSLKRTEWRSMCSTGNYSRVNGVSCYGNWNDYIHCN